MKQPIYGKLVDGKVVPCSLEESCVGMESEDRIVKQEMIGERYFVSTVFLPINHNHLGNARPIWFETMTFDHAQPRELKFGDHVSTVYENIYEDHYSTLEEARHGHEVAVEFARKLLDDMSSSI